MSLLWGRGITLERTVDWKQEKERRRDENGGMKIDSRSCSYELNTVLLCAFETYCCFFRSCVYNWSKMEVAYRTLWSMTIANWDLWPVCDHWAQVPLGCSLYPRGEGGKRLSHNSSTLFTLLRESVWQEPLRGELRRKERKGKEEEEREFLHYFSPHSKSLHRTLDADVERWRRRKEKRDSDRLDGRHFHCLRVDGKEGVWKQ